MLQELLDLIETLDFEESGGVRLIRAIRPIARQDGENSLELGLDIDTGTGDSQQWTLSCKGEIENNLSLGWSDNLNVTKDHILLWPYNKMVCTLWFNGSGKEALAVVGALWEVHHKLVGQWFPFKRFLNYSHDLTGLLAGGHGKLAEGPEPLVMAYRQVMQKYGFITSLTTHSPKYWNGQDWVKPGELVALIVGKSYVIASGVEAERQLL